MVVPWVLGNVLSGSPILFEPFVESAKYAAEYRNYHWQHIRKTQQDTRIDIPEGASPYPPKTAQILDKPHADGSGNFGRLARKGLMDTYMQRLNKVQLCGIEVVYWREFLKTFQESTTETKAHSALEQLRQRVQRERDIPSTKAQAALAIVAELERLLESST